MNLQKGVLLQGGKYKIVRHISSGGFGNTYEALDVNLDKRVAIKEFFVKDFCSRESDTTLVTIASTAKKPLIEHLKKKFIEEARAIAKMEHENIVKVQALFEENGTAYYVMDYIDGESLSALLKRRGSLPENEALPIILKVADALGYMHKQNRFHLDVKPANIMIRKDGKVILIDFGSSKQYAEVDGENTTTLAPCYTTGYAPSEQMNPKPTAFTAATDVYALGATLYKMLTGQTPPSAIDLLNNDETLSPLPQEISQNVIECVEKAMIPQRSMRMQSIEVFASLLYDVENPAFQKNAKEYDAANSISDEDETLFRHMYWLIRIGALILIVICCFPLWYYPFQKDIDWIQLGGSFFLSTLYLSGFIYAYWIYPKKKKEENIKTTIETVGSSLKRKGIDLDSDNLEEILRNENAEDLSEDKRDMKKFCIYAFSIEFILLVFDIFYTMGAYHVDLF